MRKQNPATALTNRSAEGTTRRRPASRGLNTAALTSRIVARTKYFDQSQARSNAGVRPAGWGISWSRSREEIAAALGR
jgi:hypothetical protein